MSVQDDNKALVERLLDAWNRSDFATIEGEIVDPGFVNHNPPPFPGVGADRAGLLTAMRTLRQGFPDGRAEPVQVLAQDDKVVMHDVVRGTHEADFMGIAPTGRTVAVEFIHIFRVADGRIVERWGVIDAMGLMQQLGVAMQQPAHAG